MRLQSPWQPRLAPESGSPAERLVAALAGDIIEGAVETGARLPAHRDLAHRLGIGLGTVTKAFAVLERRGLVRSVKGRGSFVAAVEARRGPAIDLGINQPPRMLSERVLANTLAALARRVDPDLFAAYPPPAGHAEHRRQMARWLAGVGMDADPERLILCNGAQQALAIAFSVACGPGGTVLTEAMTYPGAIALAHHAGYGLVGLATDGEGLLPEALERAVAARRSAGRTALYVTPTLHNPTAATMGLARRHDIVAVCRRHDVAIIEDDVYSLASAAGRPPLAMLAPERGFYANSLSKTLSPGLRIGALAVPPGRREAAEQALRANTLMVSPLSCAVMAQWLADGTAQSVRASIRTEASRRRSLARSILARWIPDETPPAAGPDGFHLFLPMARSAAEDVHAALAAAGVLVTPPHAIAVDPQERASGIRLCLGTPDLPDLRTALEIVDRTLGRIRDRRLPAAPAV